MSQPPIAAPTTHVREIPLSLITPSKTNPRKHFDPTKITELADSIRSLGVLQPVLLRPAGDRFELVAGERRFRAATQAELTTIPAVVRELTDKQTLEAQVVENLQREDLHPLEEAEGYATLLRDYGYDADTLAEKIHKSRSYVYGRIKLAALCDGAKKALWDGGISHSVALLIARIPHEKQQIEALKAVGPQGQRINGEAMSYRTAFEYIERNFMLRLQEAPFRKDDAELLPAAGACTNCPLRTGNQKELYGDVKNTDVCTSPPCYKQKLDAHWAQVQVQALERGQRILPTSEEGRVFGRYGSGIEFNAPYIEVDEPIEYGSKKTIRKALGTKLPQVTLARDPRSGQVYELISRKAAEEALLAAGLRKPSSRSHYEDDYKKKQAAETERRKLERAVEAAIIAEMRPKLATLKVSSAVLRLFTKAMALSRRYHMESVFKRRDLKWPSYQLQEKAIVKFVDGLSDGEMVLVGAELVLDFNNLEMRSGDEKDLVRQLARLVSVDDQSIEKRVRAAAAAKKRGRVAKKQQPNKKKPAAAKAPKLKPNKKAAKASSR